MLADISGKIQKAQVFHPVVIVNKNCAVGKSAVKINKTSQRFLNTCHVFVQCFFIQ